MAYYVCAHTRETRVFSHIKAFLSLALHLKLKSKLFAQKTLFLKHKFWRIAHAHMQN